MSKRESVQAPRMDDDARSSGRAPGVLTTIGIIATYFGNWPPWFPAFLVSCSANETVDWLVFTDCPEPAWCPPNVHLFSLSMSGLNELAGAKLGLDIGKRLYSQCDLRPSTRSRP